MLRMLQQKNYSVSKTMPDYVEKIELWLRTSNRQIQPKFRAKEIVLFHIRAEGRPLRINSQDQCARYCSWWDDTAWEKGATASTTPIIDPSPPPPQNRRDIRYWVITFQPLASTWLLLSRNLFWMHSILSHGSWRITKYAVNRWGRYHVLRRKEIILARNFRQHIHLNEKIYVLLTAIIQHNGIQGQMPSESFHIVSKGW